MVLPDNVVISVEPGLMGEVVDSPRPEVVEWAGEGVVPLASGLPWNVVDFSLCPEVVELAGKCVVGVEPGLWW